MIQLNPRYEVIFDPKNIDQDCDKDEHYCYFDDMYSPEYTMQWIYKEIQKHDIDAESQALLEDGHNEIIKTECYEDYGYPSYI